MKAKLDAPDDIEAAMAANRSLPLPVTIPHALAVQTLPEVHKGVVSDDQTGEGALEKLPQIP